MSHLFILSWHAFTCVIVDNLFPSETILLPPVVLDPFPLPFIVFLPQSGHLRRSNLNVPVFPNNKSLSLVIHFPTRFKVLYLHCIISILGILGPKLGILYLSPFILSRRRFHLHLSRWRNLNRGICHTPIFDLRFHLIFHASLTKMQKRYIVMCHTLNFARILNPFRGNVTLQSKQNALDELP
jgi:hypothetical protein